MKSELLLIIGGVYHVFFALFDLFWSKIFKWDDTLKDLDEINTALMKISNKLIVVIYLLFAAVSFFHPALLISTGLGKTILGGIVLYWVVRIIMQPVFFDMKEKSSIFFFILFLIGISLYSIPLVWSLL